MSSLARRCAATVFMAALAIGSQANTFSVDWTDMWWDPAESGWGVNVANQGDTVFLSFFVYGADNRPVWYSGAAVYQVTTGLGAQVYEGDLYESTGPWQGGSFDPNLVSRRKVGTVSFRAESITQAKLSYSVEGLTVSKSVTRITFANNDLTGRYLLMLDMTLTCTDGSSMAAIGAADWTVTHTGDTLRIVQVTEGTCVFTGSYSQSGRMGAASIAANCDQGVSLSYEAQEWEATRDGFQARFTGQMRVAGMADTCTATGHWSGLRR